MKLGAFSISLSVKDISKSKDFYEAIGFEVFGGNIEKNWLIMSNGETKIGLFQGMFEGNMITLNPGWDNMAKDVEDYDDIRVIQNSIESKGLDIGDKIETKSGPGSFQIIDPDGNVILFDQHR